ncbi:MAG: hypothetical protein HZA52_10785 [Planctomycetes bacterium]|nr:hypothetical protein [Planctomycetota bacterium]
MSEKRAVTGLRELLIALALGVVGSLGALPVSARGPDLFAALAWIALGAAPLGALARALDVRLLPYGVVAPAVWMGAVAVLDAAVARDLPTPFWAAWVWTGLFAAGWGVATLAGTRRAWAPAGLLCLSALLVALPEKGRFASEPWPAPVVARTLELSPLAWVTESAGAIDWPWQKSHYDALGVDRFERRAFRGPLAGPVALVVGCALAWLAAAFTRSREPSPRPAE